MLRFDPYAYEVHEDPYPVYKRLREEAPAYRSEGLGFWALSRHTDVLAGFKDVARYSNRCGVSVDRDAFHEDADATMSFLAMDPPRHTRMRGLVSRGFTPRRVAELEPHIRAIARQHFDAIENPAHCDFIEDFAAKLPMDVVSELLGVPEADRTELRTWAELVVHREQGVQGMPQSALDSALRLLHYFKQMVEKVRSAPGDDLCGALVRTEVDGDRLSDREIIGFLFLMIVAGNETTTKLLGNAIYWLARNPEQRALVRADPSLIPRWVEETLRYDNSTQALARVVCEEHELHGQKLREGDKVVLLVGSANRDERVWSEADRFDVRRSTNASLAFGQGTHFCLGAALARLEARVALEELFARHPDYELLEGASRIHSVNVRGFARLPVALPPA